MTKPVTYVGSRAQLYSCHANCTSCQIWARTDFLTMRAVAPERNNKIGQSENDEGGQPHFLARSNEGAVQTPMGSKHLAELATW